jgi:hypothetical protein
MMSIILPQSLRLDSQFGILTSATVSIANTFIGGCALKNKVEQAFDPRVLRISSEVQMNEIEGDRELPRRTCKILTA